VSPADSPSPRECPRCNTAVTPERFEGAEGVTWLWRCACGWSSAVAESGVVSRQGVRERVDESLENQEPAGNGDGEE